MTVNFTSWKGITDGQTYGIPDTSVSRPEDDESGSNNELGLEFTISQDWANIDFRVSANTPLDGGVEEFVLEDSSNNNIKTKDVTSRSAGDVVTFEDVDLSAGTYYIYLQSSDGSDVDYGRYSSPDYPYTSSDGNMEITAGYSGGSTVSTFAYSISEIGNLG